jgi:hypothetical protein
VWVYGRKRREKWGGVGLKGARERMLPTHRFATKDEIVIVNTSFQIQWLVYEGQGCLNPLDPFGV